MRRSLVLAAAVLFFAGLFAFRIGGDTVDFDVNYKAGERLRAGESLYRAADGHFMFKYFPFSALLYAPLSLLPRMAASGLWYALSVTAAAALFVLSNRLVSTDEPVRWYLLALPPVVLAKFFFRELQLGQINLLVTLLLVLMLREHMQSRDARAGALWGLATALKPYGFIFLPYWIVRWRPAALAGGLLVLAAAFALPSIFYGWERNVEIHREWYRTLSASTPGQLAVADNVSLFGFFAKWIADGERAAQAASSLAFVLALLVVAVILRGRKLPRAPVLEVALLLGLIPMVSPLGWDYQFLTWVLALTLLVHHWKDFGRAWRGVLLIDLLVIGLSIYDLVGRRAYGAFMRWSVLTACFLVLAAYVAILRFRRVA